MKELTQCEIARVSGGDGVVLPGGGYISTTSRIFNAFGVYGAVSAAFTTGYAIGSGINYGLESRGISLGGMAYDYLNGS